jgi:hypothetical protein
MMNWVHQPVHPILFISLIKLLPIREGVFIFREGEIFFCEGENKLCEGEITAYYMDGIRYE